MSFFDMMNIAASGLSAESTRMDVTSENLANAESTVGANGSPYRRQEVVLQAAGASFGSTLESVMNSAGSAPEGVEVAGIVGDPTPFGLEYDPGNPEANKQGYVQTPNVQPVTEMTDLISESTSYQDDITAMQTAKTMYSDTLNLLK